MRSGLFKILSCVILALASLAGLSLPPEEGSSSFSQSTAPTITGPDTACAGVGGYIYYTEPGKQNYFWTIIGGTITGGQYTESVTVTWNTPGSRTLTVIYDPEITPGVKTVTVLAPVVVGITITASANPVCEGTLVTFTATVTNGGSSPSYQWMVNGINAGTDDPVFIYYPNNGDIVTCQLTSGLECTTGNPVTSNPIVMTVIQNLPVSVTITASENPTCQGTMVTFTAYGTNGGTQPFYEWMVNSSNAGDNSAVFTYEPADGDVVTCIMTSSETCTTGNPAISNSVTMTVSPLLPVSVSVSASSNPACQGTMVTFTATPVNGGSPPNYQWYKGTAQVGTGQSFYSYTPVNGDQVYVVMTSTASCTTGNPATSDTIEMTVIDVAPVSITISASMNPVCAGDSVTYTATTQNGGSSPGYQWYRNNFPVGGNMPVYSYIPGNGDIIWCVLTSSLGCATGSPATSNMVTMTVRPSLQPNIYIVASSNPACENTTVQFTATAINGGTSPSYKWIVNGDSVGSNSTYSYPPQNGDTILCILTSSDTCNLAGTDTSNVIVMMVSPGIPVGVSITASLNPVCQGTVVTFTATPVNGGTSPIYSWYVGTSPQPGSTPTYTFTPGNGDVITCKLTSSLSCATGNPATSNAITMIVSSSLPVSISISPSANPSCEGDTVTFTAIPVNEGTDPTYQWKVNGANQGQDSSVFSYVPGNGDLVRCVLTSNLNCASGNPATSNQVTMSVIPNQVASVVISASKNPACQGESVTFTATPVNGGTSPAYQWKVNGQPVVGTGNILSYIPVNGDIVTCELTSSIQCPVTNPVTSNAITMVVQPILPVTISISASTNPQCTGLSVTFTATISNGGTTPVYYWLKNGSHIGGNQPTLNLIPNNNEVICCQLTSNALCYSGSNVVMSNCITMSVSSSIIPMVSIAASTNPFCQGSPVTFTATPTNGGTSPSYVWKVNCANAGTNSPVFTYTPQDNDFITCQMTSSLPCAIQNPAISNAITMKKNTGTPASVTITASENPVCTGASVTFTAVPLNGGTSPVYQWKINGGNVGSNSSTYTYTPLNNEIITCVMTSSAPCATGNPATSNAITMNVVPGMPASVSIYTPTNPFCTGTPVTFYATPVNGGTDPGYQWMINGVGAGTDTSAYTFTPFDGDVITCSMNSNSTCLSGPNPVMSNPVTMISSASIPVSISITSSATTVCQGTYVTYTANATNGGNNPSYQWKVNNVDTGTNQPTFSYVPSNGDVVTCHLTSDLTCATGNPAASNPVTMTVNPVLPVSITITVSKNPCCQGEPVTFTATGVNKGSAPVYQWKVNCVNVGGNSPTLTYTPANKDVVVCILTSNETCTSNNPAVSNNINMVVQPLLPVSVTISTQSNPFCPGDPVTFTATPVNGGSSPAYQWKVNNVDSGTGSSFTYDPSDGDIVKCRMTSNANCVSGNPAMSNQITMVAQDTLPVSVTIAITNGVNPSCQGWQVTFTATGVNGGSALYQWTINGANYGSNSPVNTLTYVPLNGDVICCKMTTSLTCAEPNPAFSNCITMTVNPKLPVSVTISTVNNPLCVGQQACFTAIPVNGGTTPTYTWRKNGSWISNSNSPTYCYVPANGDIISCRLISSETCTSGNPATSNSITMTVYPNVTPSVTISPSSNPVCDGDTVTFTAIPVNGGSSPSYQWKRNGSDAGTNSSSFSFVPSNGDLVKCVMTSNAPCVTVNPVTSNTFTVTVNPKMPVSVSITASSNPVCQGATVNFTATPTNGGSSPSYQWKRNGLPAGTGPTYSCTPSNGDQVWCIMTSSVACPMVNPATSDTIVMSVNTSLPVSVTVIASPNPACIGDYVCYTAIPVNGGDSPVYHWKKNNSDVGTNNPVYCYYPTPGDVITCQLTSSLSCASGNPAMSDPVIVPFLPNMPVSVTITASKNPACQGDTVTYTATPVNGGTSPDYEWKVNGVPQTPHIPEFSYVPVNGDVVTCKLTSNVACPVNNPATSNPINMSVLLPGTATITITASANPVCSGNTVSFSSSITNGGSSPVYHWKVNGIDSGLNQPTFSYIPGNGDTVTCQLASSLPCVSPVTSNQVVMTVSSDFPVSVTILASANPVCQGQSVTFTANVTNGGTSPSYQWKVGTMNVGANSPSFTYVPTNGHCITCTVTSSYSCATNNPAVSNQVCMVVDPVLPVSVTITSSSNPACLGSPVTFTATVTNGGNNPTYQWKVNGGFVGTNDPAYTYTPVNGDKITCTVTSNYHCPANNPATSNQITMIVGTNFPVSVSISASGNPICAGTSVTFTATPTYGGSNPSYAWKVNGVDQGPPYINTFTYNPQNNDVVTCVMTSNLACATGNPATSNAITMTVLPVPVSITITANPTGPICSGTYVTFTALPVNGGANPTFWWKVNDTLTGGNNPTFTYPPADGDSVTCTVSSNAMCAVGNTATSDPIVMSVLPLMPLSLSVSVSPSTLVCDSTLVTFTASAVNGGSDPIYQWKKNGVVIGTNTTILSYYPEDGDTITCTVTSNLTCVNGNPATSEPIVLEVLPVPVSVSITASTYDTVCEGTIISFTAYPVNGGANPTYWWKVNDTVAGTNSPNFSYPPANGDTVVCVMTSNAVCALGNTATSDPIVAVVNPLLPVSVTITSDPSGYFCAGIFVTFTASAVNEGASPSFQWKVNGSNVGTNSPVYGYTPSDGDTISCVLTSDAECATGNPATSNEIITVLNPYLPVSISIAADPPGTVCEGTEVTFTGTPGNEGSSPVYQWQVNGSNAGTNSPSFTYTPADGDAVTCILTSNAICATGNPDTSNAIILEVLPVPVSVSITASTYDTVCEGTIISFTAYPVNGGSNPTYWWKVNDTIAGTNSPNFSYPPANGDTVVCMMTSNAVCALGNTASSDPILSAVTPLIPVSVTITSDPSAYLCAGIFVTYTASPVNGGTSPSYQWKVNGSNAGSDNPVYGYTPSDGDTITCVLTSDAECATGNPATSNEIITVLNPYLPVSISIAADPPGSVCEGTEVTFSGTPENEGSSPVYQWQVNGANAGTNSPYYTYAPADGDAVKCILTSNAICTTGNPDTSNVISLLVDPLLPVGITVSASQNPVCDGTPVVFDATPVNGGNAPSYQWIVNGANAGTNSPVFSYTPVNGDVVFCILTSDAECPAGNPDTSNFIAMTVDPLLPVSVTIEASSNPVCTGVAVTFTAIPVNGGSTPSYQWKVNGNDAGTDNPVFVYTPVEGDVVTCILTSGETCPTGNPATSNAVTMTVNSLLPVSVSIAASLNPACAGTLVTFTAVPLNGGTIPSYAWKVNGTDQGADNPVFTYSPVDGDEVTCVLTSDVTCATGNPATSNTITMVVDPLLPVSISITASANPVCEGEPVSFTAAPVNGGPAPSYQWKVNGLDAGTDDPVLTYTPVDNDEVTCILTSNEACATNNPATSNIVTVTVNPILPVSITINVPTDSVCEGTAVTFTAVPVNGGTTPSYQWKVNGIDAGFDSPLFSHIPLNGDTVSCILTSNAACTTGSPAVSNTIIMTVFPLMPLSVTVVTPSSEICEGTVACFTAIVINGGSSPAFLWKLNGLDVGNNSPTFCYFPFNDDVVTCTVISNLPCASPPMITSSPVTVTVEPWVTADIVISASSNPVCEGITVLCTAVPINGGTAPSYQWKVNNINAGGDSENFSFVPYNGDAVTCILTSNASCVTNNPAMSDTIIMTVNPNLPVSVSITASANPVCAGSIVTYTAVPVNGGNSPGFQWQVNGGNAGTNSDSFAYAPGDGDEVSCILTSNAVCPAGNPDTSGIISMTVNPLLPVSVSIVSSANPVCAGTAVSFTATPVNGGTFPSYQWMVNGANAGTDDPFYSYMPVDGDLVACVLNSNAVCPTGNPDTSNVLTMTVNANPVVTLQPCCDVVTTTDAKDFKLKGGIPLGGTYSGPGVDPVTGVFSPAAAGTGNHQVIYSYTNNSSCSDTGSITLTVLNPVPVICGTPFTDPRDGKSYQTFLSGSKCWFGVNLNYGLQIASSLTQRDNCLAEKYCYGDDPSKCLSLGGFYHWDELMNYCEDESAQGFCPPGWHIPDENDWNSLFSSYGGNAYAGDALKAGGPSGFDALLAGGYFKNRAWTFEGLGGFYWSSSVQGSMKAWAHGFNDNNHGVSFYPASRSNAYSVRCIKD